MQKVSTAYKESMKSLLRERGYINVTFHLVNQEVQENSFVEDSDFAYYSNKSNVLAGSVTGNRVYATLEEDFTKVDGSMLFLPREDEGLSYFNTGIISEDIVPNAEWELTILLNVDAIDIKGLTINFGDNYPSEFDIVCDTGQTISVTDNEDAEWYTDEVFEGITSITIVIKTMLHTNNRVRIYEITFGYDLEYDNEYITSSSLESYISPVCMEIPQLDFFVQITNYDKYFDVDNPDSIINFLEIGQKIEVKYGYDTPDADDIEWIEGSVLSCSDWESNDSKAVIYGTDLIRNATDKYYDGVYSPEGVTFYDLAVEILEDIGISDYYLDSRLKELTTTNPIPNVSYREALQIIANACRCVLVQSRSGQIQIKSNFVPDGTASSNGETEYSNVNNVLTEGDKVEYASLDTNYAGVDGGMYFISSDGDYSTNTGYVSKAISDADGYFEENPVVTVELEAVRAFYFITFIFGYAVPAAFTIRSYKEGNLVSEYDIESDEIAQSCNIIRDFDECDKFEIEFTQTSEPYNHITLNYLDLSTAAAFTMEKNDMTSYPLGTKQDVVKEVIVPCYTYQKSTTVETLVQDEITVEASEEETYYLSSPATDFNLYLDGELIHAITQNEDGTVSEDIVDDYNAIILEYTAYWLKVKYYTAGTYTLIITGNYLNTTQKNATCTLATRGSTVTWENPLISSYEMATELAEWLGEYYASTIEYEYDTRGNPELDVNDIIYQENDYEDNMKVLITEHVLNFQQAFSGEIKVRRQEG